MRTTLTLEDSLASKLRAIARKRNLSFKAVVNEMLSNGLQAAAQTQPRKPFVVRPFSMGVTPGIDYDKINQFLDDEEIDRAAAKMQQGR